MATTKIRGNTQIIAATITNAEINGSAAIATSKLADNGNFILKGGSVAFTADQSLGGFKLTNVADPASAQDAATKAYVDATSSGLDVKASVRAATTAALAAYTRSGNVITADANGAIAAVDGVTLAANNRLLLKDGAAGADNGIYVVTTVGDGSNPFVLTRATDADSSAKVTAGMFTFVAEGTTNADTGWVLTTNDAITLNTTSLAFTQFSSAGAVIAGNGMTQSGQTLNVVSGNGGIVSNANDITLTLDGGTLSVGASGVKVADGGVGTTQLADDAVTSAKLDSSVAGTGITFTNGVLTPNASVVQLVANIIVRETPTPAVDGAQTAFTNANARVSGSEQVFLNGILQEPGSGNDYVVTSSTVITFETAPASTDRLRVTYLKA